jgi:hypothetical protein
MFYERSATEIEYVKMIEDIQQAMLVLPKKTAMRKNKRYQSEATQQLYIRREREMQGCRAGNRRAVKLCFAKLILKATREDWRKHVCDQINTICDAASRQDYRAVWKGINLVAGGATKYKSSQPTCHFDKATGKSTTPFETIDERTEVWGGFAIEKFSATPREINDRKMPSIPHKSERADDIYPFPRQLLRAQNRLFEKSLIETSCSTPVSCMPHLGAHI